MKRCYRCEHANYENFSFRLLIDVYKPYNTYNKIYNNILKTMNYYLFQKPAIYHLDTFDVCFI